MSAGAVTPHRRHLVTTVPRAPVDLGRLTHYIIRSHCRAPPLLHPHPLLANGINLYSLSALMSSHAERWPYHRASGSRHLSLSPAPCQVRRADGQAERVREG